MSRKPSLLRCLFSALLLLPEAQAAGQSQSPPPRCDTPAHRQFDFWVGDWVVFSGTDTAGTNVVTLEEDGCLVHEHWVGKGGGTGQSFNFYNRTDGKWHQVWVSSTGGVLDLSGGWSDPDLRYAGETVRPNGSRIRHELTFTRNADGTVRQYWRTSTDGGATWTIAFDGLYRRRK